jgi:hypothetical protein
MSDTSTAQSFLIRSIAFTIVLASGTPNAFGQKRNFKDFKEQGMEVMRPNPYDKFIALDGALKTGAINWNKVYSSNLADCDPDKLTDTKVAIPALLGFRICDGVMAIKARDAPKLNDCADDIEKLGKKLGVTDADLRRAKLVRTFANQKEWGRVFLELGYLQQDIERVLERESQTPGKAPVKKILYAAGWLQGVRYTSRLVNDHYGPKTAGLLREPLLVKALKADLDATNLPKEGILLKLSDALGKLEKLVDVELHGALSKEAIAEMATLSSKTVNDCLKEAK